MLCLKMPVQAMAYCTGCSMSLKTICTYMFILKTIFFFRKHYCLKKKLKMEKCNPIKRSNAFVQFSKDHHFGLLLVWKIRQDLTKEINATEISKYVYDFFMDDLQQHF